MGLILDFPTSSVFLGVPDYRAQSSENDYYAVFCADLFVKNPNYKCKKALYKLVTHQKSQISLNYPFIYRKRRFLNAL